MSYHENHTRSIYKAISYRILSIIIDTIFVYSITGRPKTTLSIVVATNFYSTFVYYAHERVWNHLPFGKKVLTKTLTQKKAQKKKTAKKSIVKKSSQPTLMISPLSQKSEASPRKKVVRKTTSKKTKVEALV